jgi:hypothetical protein
LSNFGFQNFGDGNGGSTVWAHNSTHRLDVPYPNGFVAGGYGGGQTVGPQIAAPFARSSSGWRTFGSGSTPRPQGARAFTPQRWDGSGNFQWANRTASPGNWRGFSHSTQAPAYQAARSFGQPSWYGNRELQPYNRVATNTYAASSATSRTPYTDRQSRPSAYGGYPDSNDYRARPGLRTIAQSSGPWGQPYRDSPSRMNIQRNSWPQSSSAPGHSFKPQHFSAPHSSSHSNSHGSTHFSQGHSGGKSHRKGR